MGGEVALNLDKARASLKAKVVDCVGLSVEHAAYGAHLIAASNMIRAIRAVSGERGRDPRTFSLFAFGGNGPLFAAGMARALGIKHVVVPPAPGLFSSFGLLWAAVEHHYSRSFRALLRKADLAALNAAFAELEHQARQQLAAEGFAASDVRIQRRVSMHYQGQTFELGIPLLDGAMDGGRVAELEEAFGREHERTYGHRAGLDEPVELVSLQIVSGLVTAQAPALPDAAGVARREAERQLQPRLAYFGPEGGWLETPVLRRAELASPREGPCIVEEYDATCLVPPAARAWLDRYGNIRIEL